jgi:hypothetical protein
MVSSSSLLGLLDLKDEVTMILQNISNYLRVYIASQPKGLETSASPVKELQILNTWIFK